MSLVDLTLVLIVITALALFWRLQQHRQQSVLAVKKYCQQANVQLLDDTIAFLGIKRFEYQGRLAWGLSYQFEFATDGEARYEGQAWFYRKRLEQVELAAHRI